MVSLIDAFVCLLAKASEDLRWPALSQTPMMTCESSTLKPDMQSSTTAAITSLPSIKPTVPPSSTKAPVATTITPTKPSPVTHVCPDNITVQVTRPDELATVRWRMPIPTGFLDMEAKHAVGRHQSYIYLPGTQKLCVFVITVIQGERFTS